MRKYEVMVIIDPDVDDRQVQPTLDQHLAVITKGGGTINNIDIWGRRRLAYEINKKPDGIYAVVDLIAEPADVKELERLMTINEAIVRTKVIRPDERRIERRKAEARAKAPEAKPEARPEAKPEARPEARPEAKPEARPEAKPEARPEAKPEAKPEARPEA